MATEKAYLILSTKHSPGGDGRALWWGPDQSGYYVELDGAGRYTLEEAESICSKLPGDAMPVSVGQAEQNAVSVVDYSKVRP